MDTDVSGKNMILAVQFCMLHLLYLIFFYYYFLLFRSYESFSRTKKKKKANNKISISQFNMSPCQNIFYLATDTFWFLK